MDEFENLSRLKKNFAILVAFFLLCVVASILSGLLLGVGPIFWAAFGITLLVFLWAYLSLFIWIISYIENRAAKNAIYYITYFVSFNTCVAAIFACLCSLEPGWVPTLLYTIFVTLVLWAYKYKIITEEIRYIQL